MKNLIYIFVIFIIISCNNTNNISLKDGIYKIDTNFYSNGKIKSIKTYIDSISYDKDSFDINGHLVFEGSYYKNLPISYFYYYNSDGNLYLINQFVVSDETYSELNQVIYFDENGDTLKLKSNYFTLFPEKDTITLGEEYVLKIRLDAPYLGGGMYVGIFEGDMIRIKVAKNFVSEYHTIPLNLGKNEINGYIVDGKEVETDSGLFTDSRYMYFRKEFYVKQYKYLNEYFINNFH